VCAESLILRSNRSAPPAFAQSHEPACGSGRQVVVQGCRRPGLERLFRLGPGGDAAGGGRDSAPSPAAGQGREAVPIAQELPPFCCAN